MKTNARVVVVGGGMMGASLLYHLALEGCSDTVLVEKNELTSGSTWHAAGQCPSITGSYNLAKIHAYSNELYPKLEALSGQYVSWHPCGGLRLANNEHELAWLKYVHGYSKSIGFSMDIVGLDEIRRLNPFLTTDNVIAAAWTRDDGHGDPSGICNALAKAARDLGATVLRHTRVLGIQRRPSGEWEVVTDKGSIAAEMVVTGIEDEIASSFAALPFDHLIFTGSTRVGRLVAEAAGRNLTPVTLELGGKSPVIIDVSADLDTAAARIAYGKLLNAGQTCIAPDYVLLPQAMVQDFASRLEGHMRRMYGADPDNADYTSIISDRHYARLEALVTDAAAKGARIVQAARPEDPAWRSKRKFPPTIVVGATPEMTIMQEEIFGPLLPIIGCKDAAEPVSWINRRDRPLALYWFGKDDAARDEVLSRTVSGGVTVNDCLFHFAQINQPMGGVGASGTGAYHGEWGFKTLSKLKPVFYRSPFNRLADLYPPYGARIARLEKMLRFMS